MSLAGTTEAPHFDRTAFKVARIYTTLAADGMTANLMLTPDEQQLKCLVAPEAFAPVPNAWGKRGATTVTLAKLAEQELRVALEMAWRHAQAQAASASVAEGGNRAVHRARQGLPGVRSSWCQVFLVSGLLGVPFEGRGAVPSRASVLHFFETAVIEFALSPHPELTVICTVNDDRLVIPKRVICLNTCGADNGIGGTALFMPPQHNVVFSS